MPQRTPTKRSLKPIIALVASMLAGCSSFKPMADVYERPDPLPATVAMQFCYEDAGLEPDIELREETRDYDLYLGSIGADVPATGNGLPITFEYYAQPEVSQAPVILVLPILNGKKHAVRPFARYFAKHGYAAVIVDTTQKTSLADDMLEPEAAIRDTVLRHRRVIDWLSTQAEIDATRIGVFGASLGAFNALYLSAVDSRIDAVVPALAGGDLPYIFVNSWERRVRASVKSARASLEMSPDEFQAFLEQKIETDLLDLAPHLNAERVFMFLARFDKVVPYHKQVELREAMGYPQARILPSGHILAAAYIPSVRKHALEFFDSTLSDSSALGTAVLPEVSCPDTDASASID